MRFRSDDQRRAFFAKLNGINRFSESSKKDINEELVSDIASSVSNDSILTAKKSPYGDINLPEGTQAVFMINEYGDVARAKQAATDASNIIASGDIRTDVVPLWVNKDLVGYATVVWKSIHGKPKDYVETPSVDLEKMRAMEFVPDYEESEPKSKPRHEPKVVTKVVYIREPLLDKYEQLTKELKDEGYGDLTASEIVSGEKYADEQKEYYDILLKAYEQSGDKSFKSFKKRFDSTYEGKKFSKKSKKDFDAIYSNSSGEFVCSYCGDAFNDRMTAASHAYSCNKNSFNNTGMDYDVDSDDEFAFL